MRRAALIVLVACSGRTVAPTPPPVAVTIPSDAGALPSTEPGILIASGEGTHLPDGTILIARDDRCVEVEPTHICNAVDAGEVEVLAGHWLLYRDIDRRFRVRKTEPRNVEFRGHRVTMALGDRASLAGVTIHWHGVARVSKTNDPVIELTISHPLWLEPIRDTVTIANPKRQLHVPKSHDVIWLSLDSVNDDATEITLVETTTDESPKTNFGDALKDGEYVFPDGLRVRYRYNRDCEYDPSTPCIWHHEITATKGETEKFLDLNAKKPTGSALGHTFRIVDEKLVVR